MRELFIYYRLRSDVADAAQVAVRGFQEKLCERHPRLIARLLCRPDEGDDWQTWMETYSTFEGINSELQAEIESAADVLLPMLNGPRHTEVFIACVW
jgi:hypothetical protein